MHAHDVGGRGGLGWLEGFNELVTRCGYEWVGHPGVDNGEPLSLHGRISNIPASRVVLTIDADFRIYRRHSRLVVPCLMP